MIALSPDVLLTWIILLPALAALAVAVSGRCPNLREAFSLAFGTAVFGLVVILASEHEEAFVQWIEILPGLGLAFRLDSLGLLFALVASFLWPVTVLYSIGYMRAHGEKNQSRFYGLFALAIAAVMGIAFAANLFTLFIFYEVLTLCTYPLVTHAGTGEAKRGGRIYLGILLATSIGFFLPAIIITWAVSGDLSFRAGGVFPADTSRGLLTVLLGLFAFGIGKAALMPFHRWLPAAMVAPTPVSALLHAVAVVKAGVFTLLKVCVFIFGADTLRSIPMTQWLLYLAGASVLLASIVAIRQDNLKSRLAYSTVSQLGYISLGALLANQAGVSGGGLHIVTHAFGKITLFFCAGAILVASHIKLVSQLSGLGRTMPFTMAAFLVGSLSIIGIPPGGGTWSKWYLLTGTLDAGQWALMAVLMLSSLLSIAYLLPIPLRAFFPPRGCGVENSDVRPSGVQEAPLPSLLAIGITAVGCVGLFLYPDPFLELAKGIQ